MTDKGARVFVRLLAFNRMAASVIRTGSRAPMSGLASVDDVGRRYIDLNNRRIEIGSLLAQAVDLLGLRSTI